ncbi:MAG: hypothetical protein OSA43_12265, partial [Pirellulales bacterium]|nr:hypothetical protein [Pirellulales bacterium]
AFRNTLLASTDEGHSPQQTMAINIQQTATDEDAIQTRECCWYFGRLMPKLDFADLTGSAVLLRLAGATFTAFTRLRVG